MWSCRPKIGQKSRSFWGGAQGRVRDRYMDSLIASNYRKNGYCKIFGILSSFSRFLTPLTLHFRWFAEVSRITLLIQGRIAQRSVLNTPTTFTTRRVVGGVTKVLWYTEQVNLIKPHSWVSFMG